jgi:hypothetical protein
VKGHRGRQAACPQRIRLVPSWESYNHTDATGFAPLTGKRAKSLIVFDDQPASGTLEDAVLARRVVLRPPPRDLRLFLHVQ